MAPPVGTPIDLDKKRVLRYTTKALMQIEMTCGQDFGTLQVGLASGSITAVVALLLAGLLHDDDTLSLNDVAEMVPLGNVETVRATISTALTESFPKGDGKKKEPNG